MARTHSFSITCALIVCMVGAQCGEMVFASEARKLPGEHPAAATSLFSTPSRLTERWRFTFNDESVKTYPPLASTARDWSTTFHFVPAESSESAAQVYQGHPRPMKNGHGGSIAALTIGAIASIVGSAVLVYANRPDCHGNEFRDGCSYGTKVVGGAVLAGGMVGLIGGALTW